MLPHQLLTADKKIEFPGGRQHCRSANSVIGCTYLQGSL